MSRSARKNFLARTLFLFAIIGISFGTAHATVSSLTVIVGASGSGTQDANLVADGIIASGDAGGGADTVSTGALQAVAAGTNISITVTTSITFNDLGGTLTLAQGLGRSVSFTANSGAIIFNNTTNTLATSGASLSFTAGTNLTVSNLSSANVGDVSLIAGISGAGNLSAQSIAADSSGNIALQATNAAGGTITQTGVASGALFNATATGTVTVDSPRAPTIALTSNTGAIASLGANAIQASSMLTLSSATGATVNTLAATLQASNNPSGNISVTQAAAPAQTLTITGSGVSNSAAGGTVTITNLGSSIAINGGVGVGSNNGAITLAALDFQISGTVNSGTARTTLANSIPGRQIDLGTNTAGKIGLTQTELNNVTAGVLQIGSATAGNISVTAPITNPGSWNTLTLVNNDTVTETGMLTLPNLRCSSFGPVTLNGPNNVGVVASSTTNTLTFTNGTNPLVIGMVDGVTGITAITGVTLTVNNLDIQQVINAGGDVTIMPFSNTQIINLGGADAAGTLGLTNTELGRITATLLRIGSFAANGGITTSSAISRHGYNSLSLFNNGAISQSAALSVANLDAESNTGVTLTNAGNDVDLLAGFAGGGGNFLYTDINALIIGIVAGNTSVHADGIASITTGGPLTINELIEAFNTRVTLNVNGVVTEGVNGHVFAPNLQLLGPGPYTLTNATNTVGTLAANVTGAVVYTDADALSVGTVNGTVGVTTGNSPIAITTIAGPLAVTGGNPVSGGSASVSLTAGSPGGVDNLLNVLAAVTGTGGVTLTADNMTIGAIVNAGANTATLQPFQANTLVNLGGADAANTLGLTDFEIDFVIAGIIVVGNTTAGTLTVTAPITPAGTTRLFLQAGAQISDAGGGSLQVPFVAAQAGTGITLVSGASTYTNLEAQSTTIGMTIAHTGTLTIGGVTNALTGIREVTSGNILVINAGTINLADTDGFENVRGGSTSGDINLAANGGTADIASVVDEDALTAPHGSITLNAGRDILMGTAGTDFDNDIRADFTITLSAGRNVTIDGFSDVASDDFGLNTGAGVSVTSGTLGAGNITISTAHGTDASIGAGGNAAASVSLTCMNGGIFTNQSQLFSNTGNITVRADGQDLQASGTITATQGTVNLRANSAGVSADLGSAAAGFNFTSAELNTITAKILLITASLNINVSQNIALAAAKVPTLSLEAAGGGFSGSGGANLGVTKLIFSDGAGAGHTYNLNNFSSGANSIKQDANGTIPYSTTTDLTLNAGTGSDTFNVTPSTTTAFHINGNAPVITPGDTLNVDTTGATGTLLSSSNLGGQTHDGRYTFTNRQTVFFTSIETLSPAPGAVPTASNGTVSGFILDQDGHPVEGVGIWMNGTQTRLTVTDARGFYQFDNVEENGLYSLTPARLNYNFSPAARQFSQLGQHTDAAFTAIYNGQSNNPLDRSEYFVRQQYVDLLGREPDELGFTNWVNGLNTCAPDDAGCDRIHVSEMFFRSPEFQDRGYYLYRFYSTAFGRKPDYAELTPDMTRVSGFLTEEQLEAAKAKFAEDFTTRPLFVSAYGGLNNADYVDALLRSAQVSGANRDDLISALNSGTQTRAQVLRQIAESSEVYNKYYNQAFVVMEYFGYLHRDPDALYLNWIDVLNQTGDPRHMIEGFVNSTEYRQRFQR